jgi:hypothetical protein
MVQNPFHVGGHARVARYLIGAQLHALRHDTSILNRPIDILRGGLLRGILRARGLQMLHD